MRTVTKYVSASGAQISADWWAADDGTHYLVRALSDEQRQALGITTTTEQIPEPPAPSLASQKSMVVAQIDAEVDAIYRSVIGERQPEYAEAEKEAQAYKDAGYTGSVPGYVASWVTASGKTAQAAADDILSTAQAWRAAAGAMRAARLGHKAQAGAATTQAALDAVRASWVTSIGQIRAALGL